MYQTNYEKRLYVVDLKIKKTKNDYRYTAKDIIAALFALTFLTVMGPNMSSRHGTKTIITILRISYLQGCILSFSTGIFIIGFVILGLRTQHRKKLKRLYLEKKRIISLINSERQNVL